jgi:hypothetical protein
VKKRFRHPEINLCLATHHQAALFLNGRVKRSMYEKEIFVERLLFLYLFTVLITNTATFSGLWFVAEDRAVASQSKNLFY